MARGSFLLLVCAGVTAWAQKKVEVHLYWESGCPFSNRFILGPLNDTLEREGLMDVMNFHAHPFGNAYFVTQECGGGDGTVYDKTVRACYEKKCGLGAAAPPADCTTGKLVSQHGDFEGSMNRLLNCAKASAHGIASWFMPYATCVSWFFIHGVLKDYPAAWRAPNDDLVARQCSALSGLPFGPIDACWKDAVGSTVFGGELLKQEARSTPLHPFVPWVTINGQPLEDKALLLKSICAAYAGPKPKGCLGDLTVQAPTILL